MSPTLLSRTLLALLVLAATVGAVDAGVGRHWDLFAVFVAIAALAGALAMLASRRRPLVPVRADLARWLERYAVEGAERTADVADRAIAAYRAGIVGDVEDDRARARDGR